MYAVEHGFVGGFPTYNNEDYGSGMVCGAILLRAEAAEYREVPLAALGNPALGDFEQRFRATQDYASANGFVGGFPNLLQSEKKIDFETGQRFAVCGTILLRSGSWDMTTGRRLHIAEWRNV